MTSLGDQKCFPAQVDAVFSRISGRRGGGAAAISAPGLDPAAQIIHQSPSFCPDQNPRNRMLEASPRRAGRPPSVGDVGTDMHAGGGRSPTGRSSVGLGHRHDSILTGFHGKYPGLLGSRRPSWPTARVTPLRIDSRTCGCKVIPEARTDDQPAEARSRNTFMLWPNHKPFWRRYGCWSPLHSPICLSWPPTRKEICS